MRTMAKPLTLDTPLLDFELLPLPLREGTQLPDGNLATNQRLGQQADSLLLHLEGGFCRLTNCTLLLELVLGYLPSYALLLELCLHPGKRRTLLLELGWLVACATRSSRRSSSSWTSSSPRLWPSTVSSSMTLRSLSTTYSAGPACP